MPMVRQNVRWPAASVAAFASGLKAHLRANGGIAYADMEDTSGHGSAYVDWEELDAAIDAFATEFQGKR